MTTRSIHARAALDDGLAQLQADLRAMTSLLDVAIERSVLSLQTLDQRLAGLVIDSDDQINRMRFQIEDRAIHLIATQQPIAGDLRFIVAVLMVVSEIERMGDYAAGIAKVVQLHENRQLLKPLIDIPEMARLVREMLREAVDAFLRRNEHTAERVAFQDDEVDRLYDIVYRELLQYMANDPTTIDRATWLLWVAHNLERMGDRIQNICERTVYEVTGVMREFSSHGPRQPNADA
ncbi:MAG: phosphate signaling complex protein PhoU [Candidatus Limnocylindria bacterium]